MLLILFDHDEVLAHATGISRQPAKGDVRGTAFNTVPSEVLFGVYETQRKARPSLVYCGDDSSSKTNAADLIRDAGFDPVDAGPLRIARYTEPFALLIAQLAYEGKGGQNWPTGSSGSGNRIDPTNKIIFGTRK